MHELYYIYPIHQFGSFHLISKQHIAYLRKYVHIQEIDEEVLNGFNWVGGKKILLHPILYFLMDIYPEFWEKKYRRLLRLLEVKDLIGGFETSDSNQISDRAVEICNHFDDIFLPSKWAVNVFKSCGVKAKLHLLPHGLDKAYSAPKHRRVPDQLTELYRLKREKKAILILYFLLHSGYRKGADLVAKAVKPIQDRYKNVFLVVKRELLVDPYIYILRMLKTIEIAGRLSICELVSLYDLCDILIVPSRGGGFELNAIEGLARGLPTLAPNAGCFRDYIQYAIPVAISGYPRVLKGNPIHIGKGFEINLKDFIQKLLDVIEHLGEYKLKFMKQSKIIAEEYQWSNICGKLVEVLRKRGYL